MIYFEPTLSVLLCVWLQLLLVLSSASAPEVSSISICLRSFISDQPIARMFKQIPHPLMSPPIKVAAVIHGVLMLDTEEK